MRGAATPNELHVGLLRARGMQTGRGMKQAKIAVVTADGTTMDAVQTGVTKSANPVWNAIFSFEVPRADAAETFVLAVTFEYWDAQCHDNSAGCVLVPLPSLQSNSQLRRWWKVEAGTGLCDGEIELVTHWIHNPILLHSPSKTQSEGDLAPNELVITLVRGRGLHLPGRPRQDSERHVDPFVRLSVGSDSWDSTTFGRGPHPVWHETCAIPLRICDDTTAQLTVSLIDSGSSSVDTNATLGLHFLLARSLKPLRSWIALGDSGPTTRATGEVDLVLRLRCNSSLAPCDAQAGDSANLPNLLRVALVRARVRRCFRRHDLSFGDRGACDPYVVIRHGRRFASSSVIFQTQAPAWHEAFAVPSCMDADLHCNHVTLEVIHCGRGEASGELLGYCSVDIPPDAALNPAGRVDGAATSNNSGLDRPSLDRSERPANDPRPESAKLSFPRRRMCP